MQHQIVSQEEWLAGRKKLLSQGEGIHPAARSAERRAPRVALGQGRQAVRLRRTGRQGDPGRPVRRAQPADRLSFHVRSRMGAGLPELLVRGRSHRRRELAPAAARRDPAVRSPAHRFPRSKPSSSAWAGASSGCRPTGTTSTMTITCRSRRTKWRGARSTTTTAWSSSRARKRRASACSTRTRAATIFHTYSAYARGLDMLVGAYNYLDLVPKGRDEADLPWTMAWVRHHDRYDV